MIHLLLHFIFEILAVRGQIDMETYVIEVTDIKSGVCFDIRGCLKAQRLPIGHITL